MKRLLRKDNRIARLVALWLVFIMALTPLYKHSGFKNPTKAASQLVVNSGITKTVYNGYVTIDEGISIDDNTFTFSAGANAVTVIPDDINIASFASSIEFYFDLDAPIYVGNVTEPSYIVKDVDVCYVVADTDPGESIESAYLGISDSNTIDVSSNKDIYVYLKSVTVSDTEGTFEQTYTTNDYAKIAKVKVTTLNEGAFSGAGWVNGEATVNTYASSATISLGFECIDNVKYIATNNSNLPSDSQWAAASTTPVTVSENEKSFYGYIGVFDGDTNVTAPGYVYKIDSIKIDNVAPAINNFQGAKIYSTDGRTQYANIGPQVTGAFTATYSDVVYIDSNVGSVMFCTYVKENNLADGSIELGLYESGSDTPSKKYYSSSFDAMGTDGGYYTTTVVLSELTENTVYQVKAKVKDKAGNESDILYATILPIDKTFKVENVKYYEVDGEGNETEIPSIKGLTNKQQRVKFTVTSGDKLGRAEVYGVNLDSSNRTLDNVDLTGVAMYNGLYKVDVTLDVPKDKSVETTLNAIKLYVAEDGTNSPDSKTIDLAGSYKLDLTKPSVEPVGFFEKESWKDGNNLQNWVQLSEGNGYSDHAYKIDYDLNRDFRYVFQISDANGIEKVEGYLTPDYSDTPVALTHDTVNGEQYYYMQYSTSQVKTHIQNNGPLKLYIKAYDNAGNVQEFGVTPTIIERNNNITIDSVHLQYEDGELVNFNSTQSINKAHYVVIKASSGEYITEVILQYKLNGVDKEIVCPVAQADQNIETDSKRKVAIAKITLPEDETIDTAKLTEMKLIVHDTGTDAGTGLPNAQGVLYDLLYDSTKPTITVTQPDGTTFVEDNAWIKLENETVGYVVDAVVTPGVGAYETKITSANYKIENSVKNKETNGALDYEHTVGEEANGAYMQVAMFESLTAEGTKVTFNAVDQAGNPLESGNPATPGFVIKKRIDGTAPSVRNMKVNGNENNYTPLGSTVNVTATAVDRLSLDKVYIRVENLDTGVIYKPEQDFTYGANDALNEYSTEVTRDVSYQVTLPDGTYKATVQVVDKAGWESTVESRYFVVDGTAPELTAAISTGTKGNTNYHYRSDVTVSFTCKEEHVPTITVKDNGEVVPSSQMTWTTNAETGLKEGTYVVKTDGQHTVTIEASDATGNVATSKSVEFIRDTQPPTVTPYMNGLLYSNTGATRVNTNNTTVQFAESESVYEFYYSVTKTVPDETPIVGAYNTTSFREFIYSEEATYKVQVYAVDMAGNVGEVSTIDFRIDKTAPNISIGGVAAGGTSSTAVNLSLNMNELYWSDASGTVEIYMKQGEGFGEELIEQINYTPTGRNSVITRNLSESGIYRVEFNAQDSAGHTSTASSTFTIDTEVPVVTLEGVSNYDVTDQDVTISSTITEKFYASKRVIISGTVTDETGKVTPITIDDYSPTANPTVINKTFSDDGIYDLTISCVDVAGNSDSKSVHFIIDKSEPVIGDLSDLDGKILTSFSWDKDLDDLVSDLTVCDVHMYLNGQEYDGEEAVEDGSYVLLITAEDELGHKVEKTAEFVLDTKAPVFIVTGVEDKDKKIEPYNITVSLQLEEDSLTKVTLNDKVITITNNTATINVTEIGEYTLYMEAVDEAGNVSSAEYKFELMSEEEFNFRIIIGIVAALLVLTLLIIILKKRKNKDK